MIWSSEQRFLCRLPSALEHEPGNDSGELQKTSRQHGDGSAGEVAMGFCLSVVFVTKLAA